MRAEALERGVDQGLDLVGLAHVGLERQALGAELPRPRRAPPPAARVGGRR